MLHGIMDPVEFFLLHAMVRVRVHSAAMCACVLENVIDCLSVCAIGNCTLFFGLGRRLYHPFVLSAISYTSSFSVSVGNLLLVFISDLMFISSSVTYSSGFLLLVWVLC